MNYYQPGSTMYHGLNPGTSNDEDNNLHELMAVDEDENVVEGRVIYVSPVSTFNYNLPDGRKKKGSVQNYIILDVLAQKNNKPIYTYRVTAWNDQVSSRLFKKEEYYRLSNFAWKENTFFKRPEHQSHYDVHLKANSLIELIPHVPHMQ